MLTDYMNSTPEIVQIGNWTVSEGNVQLSVVTVGSGNPVKDTLRFKLVDSSLVYEGDAYGSQGLTLAKKESPAPVEKNAGDLGEKRIGMRSGPGFRQNKMLRGAIRDKRGDTWRSFPSRSKGFSFEKRVHL